MAKVSAAKVRQKIEMRNTISTAFRITYVLSSKDLLQGSNLCRGVYAQQTLYKSSFMCMVVAKCPEFPSREGSSVKP